jgi:DtxR family Mn-dependent transcriptional regulator
LDAFLGYPQFDPHGDPIPNGDGQFPEQQKISITQMPMNVEMLVCGVAEDSATFLAYLQHLNIHIGITVKVLEKEDFDDSYEILIGTQKLRLTAKAAENILVKKTD